MNLKSACEQSPAGHERNLTFPSVVTTDAKVARVKALLHGLSLILRHHSAPYEVVKDCRRQLSAFLTVDQEELFLKRAKYILALPMSRYLKNEDPPKADADFQYQGRFWRWARQRINAFRSKNTHLWYSFLQAKRAAEPVSPEIVLSNFQKHRAQMEQPDPLREGCEEDEELQNEVLENLAPVLRKLRKILKQELTDFFRNPQQEIHKGSESASFESSRKTGGQAGHLRTISGVTGLREQERFFGAVESRGHVRTRRGLEANPIASLSARFGELEDLEEVLQSEVKRFERSTINLKAQVEAVLEPMKVRTISKGESLPYYLAKRVQLVLHGAMRKMDCFRLIGAPLDPSDLLGIRKNTDVFTDSSEGEWLSIDYSAATDGLSASLSSSIMKELLGNLYFENPGLYNMMLSVLAPHIVSYPKVAGTKLPDVLQRNGQLMGSVLSFPVLCLANLGLYLTVRRRHHEWAPYRSLLGSVLVNGDDMLYIGSRAEWDTHIQLGSRIGLAMSVGKAYYHSSYANVNSTSVTMNLRVPGSTPKEIKFLNVGLMVGRHKVLGKVGSDDDEVKASPIVSVIDEVVKGSLPGKQVDILKLYLSSHEEEIRREAGSLNLFVPRVLGGLGVSIVPGFEVYTTPYQERLAVLLKEKQRIVPLVLPLNSGQVIVSKPSERKVDPFQLAVDVESSQFERKDRLALPKIRKQMLWPLWAEVKELEVSREQRSDFWEGE